MEQNIVQRSHRQAVLPLMKSMRQSLCSIMSFGEPSGKSASENKFDVTALQEKKM